MRSRHDIILITIKVVIIDLLFTSFRRRQHQQLLWSRHETPSLEQNGFGWSTTSPVAFLAIRDYRLSRPFLFSILLSYSSYARRTNTNTLSPQRNATRTAAVRAYTLFCFDFRFKPFLPHRHDGRTTPVRRPPVGGVWWGYGGVSSADLVGVDDILRLPVPR